MHRYELKGKRVWVCGHRGMVGSAIMRRLGGEDVDILTVDRAELDLRDSEAVERWMRDHRPDAVFLAAAKVGGILANNSYPADFIFDNLMISANVIHAAHRCDVEKLLNLGSSCIYPRDAKQPITEDELLTGPLEPTNQWYAIAKIAAVKLCEAYRAQHGRHFISAMPTNLYGPGDNYNLKTSHVLPALIAKFTAAAVSGSPSVEVWGSGRALREFMHVDDLADACVHLIRNYDDPEHINVGSGDEVSIADLARLVADKVGFRGAIRHDRSMPDGTPRKRLDSSRLEALGWRPRIPLEEGVEATIAQYRATLTPA